MPPFPPRKLFGNKDPEFIKLRQLALDSYFKIIFTNPLCENILDSINIKEFLYTSIWSNIEENFHKKTLKIKDWNEIIVNKKSTVNILKNEIKILDLKYQEIYMDMDILEQNDTIWILHFEEKKKEEELLNKRN